jgi:hypothetical protein
MTSEFNFQNIETNKLYIADGAYAIKDPPPICGYWVLPCQEEAYATMFAAYSRPNWFHRKMMSWVLGFKWREKNHG